jgi:hypothetical protein
MRSRVVSRAVAGKQLDTVAASGRKGQVQSPPAAPASANQAPRRQCLIGMVKCNPTVGRAWSMTHVPMWQRLVGKAKCNHRLRLRLRPTRHPAGSVWSKWSSARPLAFPDAGDAEGVPSALARGIVPKWTQANHRLAIDGAAVKLPDSQALHCQPQLGARRGKKL